MTLRVSYDQEFNILDLDTGERCSDGASLLAPALSGIAVRIKTDGGHDVAGLIVMGASACLSPHFARKETGQPFPLVDPPISDYDRETDTLTLGFTADNPAMITQDNDYLIAYWQPDPNDAEDFLDPIGVSLLNASQHLAPFFVRVEPADGGEGQG